MKKILFIICMFFMYPVLGYAMDYDYKYEKTVNYNQISDYTSLPSIENDRVWSKLNREITIDNTFFYRMIMYFIIFSLMLALLIILIRKYIKDKTYN